MLAPLLQCLVYPNDWAVKEARADRNDDGAVETRDLATRSESLRGWLLGRLLLGLGSKQLKTHDHKGKMT